MVELIEKELTGQILDAAIEVHRELGPGLLESVYEICLAHLLLERGMDVQRQVAVPVHFRGLELETGYRADLVVNHRVLLELKSVEAIESIHGAQLMTYLKLTGLRVGLLMNFNVPRLRDGIRRRVL